MSRSDTELKILNLVELYCRDFAVRLGYERQDVPNETAAMARFLDKKISKGHFRTGGVPNYNPVILNLFGGLKLYWLHVLPALKGVNLVGTPFANFFRETYTRVMLHRACNGNLFMDEVIIRIAAHGETAFITLLDLDTFYYATN